jgi:hypothetical protein
MTLAVVTLLAATGCSKGDDDSASIDTVAPSTSQRAPGPITPAPCKENRHYAVFDVNGTLTMSDQQAARWLTDPAAEPDVRPGAADLVTAYRQDGYEIMYVTSLPATTIIAGQPVADAYKGWLERHGFPVDGPPVNTTTTDKPSELSGELVALAGQGAKVDVGYTNKQDKVEAFETGGVAKVFTLGIAPGTAGTTAVPGDNLVAKVGEVKAEPKICS